MKAQLLDFVLVCFYSSHKEHNAKQDSGLLEIIKEQIKEYVCAHNRPRY